MPEATARRVVIGVFLATLVLATRRLLTFDEAYYLAAARDLVATGRVPIDDHPPLLLGCLALFDRLPVPVELRVRLLSASLALGTALSLGALARATGGARSRALLLGSVGILPVVSGLVATPDTPLLLGETWLLLGLARGAPLVAGLGAWVAGASKASGLFVAVVVLAALLAERPRRPRLGVLLAAVAVGAALALPLSLRSLVLQAAHVAGRGPLVSAPSLGPPLALVAWATSTGLLVGPALLWMAGDPRAIPAGRALVLATVGALVLSALVSGRPPEAGWIGPAVPVWIAAAARSPWSRVAALSYVAPTVVGVALWLLPGGPLEARAPRHAGPPWPTAPLYGEHAWSRIYR